MSTLVTASLCIIGNEILSGRTQDKNLAYLATELNRIGIQLREVRVVPDIESEIIEAVNALRSKYDYLFTTGGIGPTHDDITTASIAKAFGVKVIRHPEAERLLRAHYTPEQINEARLKMADVAEGSELIPNVVSAAPGFRIGNVFVMAGVPKIMQAMLIAAIPHLKGGAVVQSVNITTNLPEGTIAAGLTDIQSRYTDIDIGSYPLYQEGKPSTTLVFRGIELSRAKSAAEETKTLIAGLGGHLVENT
ncbi:MAG: competence/damage-inducible protein A [Alphaproteobacteria bacterium]|nr:competence/damage-inducible protein A [Alphaproteobacteria bacterium]